MAVVVYKCDVCKRDLDTVRNIEGLERVDRCTITHGCRGKMYQKGLFPDYKRGQLPHEVIGLDDWQQRRVLYDHTQAIESDRWLIQHNLGTVPSISVFVDRPLVDDADNRDEIIPEDVQIVTSDVMILVFARPYSGIAQLVARQSDPDLVSPHIRDVVDATQTATQFSATGEVTIATRLVEGLEPPAINIQIAYQTTGGGEQLVSYTADDQPSIQSPWSDVDTVVIRGKIYTIRSFNAIIAEMTTGAIGNGSTFRFVDIDVVGMAAFRPIERTEILLMLATSPYDTVDKVTNKFIDVSDVTATENPFGFIYDTGELYALDTIVRPLFPPIHSI